MTTLDRINGAIIGLDSLREHLEKIKKKENQPYFITNSNWIGDFIEYRIMIYKKIKIKELESLLKIKQKKNKGIK